ncbi:MAG TPA: hypothetical protein VHO29_06770 [Marmoricola sp.]|nr:hypothetical protein [Marmoricola sp.]
MSYFIASPRSGSGMLGAGLLAAGCVIAATGLNRFLSIGGITMVIGLFAFLAKWLINLPPASPRVTSYDNDVAISVAGLFFFSFFAAWRFSVTSPPRIQRRAVTAPHLSGGKFGLLAVTAVLMIGLRRWLAETYSIGVPGVVPQTPGGFGRLFGGLYYVSVYFPLGLALMLLVTRQRSWLRPSVVALVLVGYAWVGASIGSRGAAVLAGGIYVLGIVWSAQPTAGGGSRRSHGDWLAAVGALSGVLYGVGYALRQRASGYSASGDSLAFIAGRVGGLDYLSPAVVAVRRFGMSHDFLEQSTWNHFLNVTVYHLPTTATNGSAATLPGWMFGVGGAAWVVGSGVFAGVLGGILDSSRSTRGSDAVSKLRLAGAVLAWSILLLEGNLSGAVYVAGMFAALALSAAPLVSERRPNDLPAVDLPTQFEVAKPSEAVSLQVAR